MRPVLSIIYVYHNTPDEIIDSINSLNKALGGINSEIIVVDNASIKAFPNKFNKNLNVKVIKNKRNFGYGRGLNQGVSLAQGEYVVLANSDLIFKENSIRYLWDKIKRNQKIGIIAPQLISENGEILKSISDIPFLPQSLFIFSFISKIWPNNPVSNTYHKVTWDKNKEHEVSMVGGACMLIKKSLFNDVQGFDERFFMYFEEADFCYKVKRHGYKILYYPKAKVIHLIARSNSNKEWIEKTFEESRFKFFRKYHGFMSAFLGEAFIRLLNPTNILLFVILLVSAYLNFYKINDRMIFIGDQGWFYLSARDMLVNGQIPLVGIASSHPWLHQGPLWTYLLAFILWIFNYDPISGGYFTALLGVITVIFVYKLGKKLFSKRIALISALLFSTSPLIVITSQMPYHTSLIPLLTLLFFFSLYKFIKGSNIFLPLSILFLSILYNLELSTIVLWFILFLLIFYGFWKKAAWVKKILSKEILIYSILSFVIPMLPILIYDFYNNFPQTLKLVIWVGYRILSFIGIVAHEEVFPVIPSSMLAFSFHYYQNLIFAKSGIIAFIFLLFSLFVLLINVYNLFRKKIQDIGFVLIVLWIVISLTGYFVNKSPSGAYLIIFFPVFIYLFAFSLDKAMRMRTLFIPTILLIIFIVFVNIFSIVISEDFVNKSNFSKRLAIAKEMVKEAKGRKYNIVGIGEGSKFESFTMNYEYLTWWLGHAPVKSSQKLKYTVKEDKNGVFLEKNE